MNLSRLIPAAIALATIGAAHAQAPDEFRGLATLRVIGSGEGVHRAELPLEAYRHARKDLSDIRVFNGKGEPVPFAFAAPPPAEAPKREAIAVPLFPIRSAPGAAEGDVSLAVKAAKDGTLIALRSRAASPKSARTVAWLADASAMREPYSSVLVDWDRKPGLEVARVNVEVGDDLKSWETVATGTVVSLEHEGRKLSQTRLEMAPRKAKYLRITSRTDGFALTGLQLEIVKAAPEPGMHTLTVGGRTLDKPGEFAYDLQAAVPVARLQLLLPEANAVAPVSFLARDDEKSEWRAVTSATFHRLVRGGEEVRSAPISVAPYAARYWLARVDTKAGVIPSPPRLEARWTPATIVFVTRGEGPFRLAFGHATAKAGALPIATLIPGYERGAETKLNEVAVTDPRERSEVEPFSWAGLWAKVGTQKGLLWAVLVGGVLFLAIMAWRIGKATQ